MTAGTTTLSPVPHPVVGPHYKWVVLSNTTVGVLLATLNGTSLMIALPVIFRGIHLNPLAASNFPYLLWIMMGYVLVSAAVVVTVGRIGDMYGRTKMYNLGFAWFTVAAILLSVVWSKGSSGAMELVILRMFQAVGGALLMANSAAIITDAFPADELGLALGMNMIAAIFGSFLGILAGGLLSEVGWRWVFLANVPIGVFGTLWAYLRLKEIGVRIKAKIDWLGNLSFAAGLAMILTGATYGIKPYGHSLTGWRDPFVLEMLSGGVVLLVIFAIVEMKVAEPMFRLSLFRIRAFTAGNAASFLGAIGRGGLQFMLMIWFQGIWLPQHGYSFVRTPLWAGIYMLPFMLGFVFSGPISGRLSDRYGARPFATGGMLVSAAMYVAMMTFPANFSYWPFAVVMFVSGIGGGLFAAPNTASIMNSVPARHRGAASGMRVTFAQVGMPLSMGLFFSLLVFGLNAKVPAAMYQGLVTHGVPAANATQLSHLPPLGYIFAAFLGLNPLKNLLGPVVLGHLAPAQAAALTSRAFFPQLIGPSFKHGLLIILGFAAVMSVVAALASALRGEKFVHEDDESAAQKALLSSRAVATAGVNGTEANATGARGPTGPATPDDLVGAVQERPDNAPPGTAPPLARPSRLRSDRYQSPSVPPASDGRAGPNWRHRRRARRSALGKH
jgi:MFS family permease